MHTQETSASKNGRHISRGLRELIDGLLDINHGDVEAAAEDLHGIAKVNDDVRDQVQTQTLAYICREAVAQVLRSRRSQVLNGGGQRPDDTQVRFVPADLLRSGGHVQDDAQQNNAPALTLLSDGHRSDDAHTDAAVAPSSHRDRLMQAARYVSLMDRITLPVTHKPLRSATRDDLVEAVDYYYSRAAAYKQRHSIFAAILERVPEGKEPADVLTDDVLQEIING